MIFVFKYNVNDDDVCAYTNVTILPFLQHMKTYMMTSLENISVSNRAWNFHCFRVFALGKVNLRGYIVAGEWGANEI